MNKYTYQVPFTEEQLVHDYVELGMTQKEVGVKYGTSQKVVWNAMRKMGLPSRKAAKRNQRGPLNSYWKGGRFLIPHRGRQIGEKSKFGNGYIYVLDPDHPNAGRKGYVAEHVKIAGEARGAPLSDGELVHHIDLNKENNAPSNLAVTNFKMHALWHAQLEEIAVEFMRRGMVSFDPSTGYHIAK